MLKGSNSHKVTSVWEIIREGRKIKDDEQKKMYKQLLLLGILFLLYLFLLLLLRRSIRDVTFTVNELASFVHAADAFPFAFAFQTFLPQSDFVVPAAHCQDVAGDGPTDPPHHIPLLFGNGQVTTGPASSSLLGPNLHHSILT